MPDPIPFVDLHPMTREVRASVYAGWSHLLERSHFIGGEAVEEFESAWAQYCGTTHAVGVANGTDALHLALRALDIGPGDEVIVPANTFVATAEAVVLAGATPRFADVSPHTLLLTAETTGPVITPRTKAIIAVHLYGQMADVDELLQLADATGLTLIEDAAQAHGASWQGRPAGSFGRVGCFSFYPAKNLGAFGDAGAVVTSDDALADRIRSMRDHGRDVGSHYQHGELGMNSRLDAVQATVLLAKLDRLDSWNNARRKIAEHYRSAFAFTPVDLVAQQPQSCSVYHLAVARVTRRDEVRRRFTELGITTAVHYPEPCHLQPPFACYAAGPLPVAEQAAHEVLSLPMYPHLSAEQVARVCEAIDVVFESGELNSA